MAETIEKTVSQGATGRVVRIVGAVVDVEFPPDQMPAIYNALTVNAKTPSGEISTVLEVQTHLPGDLVRTVAMSSTDGMVRGIEAVDTGSTLRCPWVLRPWAASGTSWASRLTASRCLRTSSGCPFIIPLPRSIR